MSECIRPRCTRSTHGVRDGLCRTHRAHAGHHRRPADLPRKRIERWLAEGHSLRSIAHAAGIAPETVRSIRDGERKTCHTSVFRGVMTAQPSIPGLSPALPYVRMLRALAAAGWTGAEVADRAGLTAEYLSMMRSGRYALTVKHHTAAGIQAVFDDLGELPVRPADPRIAKRSWKTPGMWDDEHLYALPPYWERAIGKGPRSLEWQVCLWLQAGRSHAEIAQEIGIHKNSLVQIMSGRASGAMVKARWSA